jgi:hypothetical protein
MKKIPIKDLNIFFQEKWKTRSGTELSELGRQINIQSQCTRDIAGFEGNIRIRLIDIEMYKNRIIELQRVLRDTEKMIKKLSIKKVEVTNQDLESNIVDIQRLPIEKVLIKNFNGTEIIYFYTKPLKLDILRQEIEDDDYDDETDKKRTEEFYNQYAGRKLGQYIIAWTFNSNGSFFRIFNATNRALTSYDHMCVSSTDVCFGSATGLIDKLKKEFDIYGVLETVIDFLINPYSSNPYCSWKRFFENLEPTGDRAKDYGMFGNNAPERLQTFSEITGIKFPEPPQVTTFTSPF